MTQDNGTTQEEPITISIDSSLELPPLDEFDGEGTQKTTTEEHSEETTQETAQETVEGTEEELNTTEVEEENQANEDIEEEAPKKKGNGFSKKLRKLTTRNYEKDAEIAALKAQIASQAQPKPDNRQVENEAFGPNPDHFADGNTDPEYLKEMATHAGRKAYQDEKAKDDKIAKQTKGEEIYNKAAKNYQVKTSQASEKYEDFDDVITESSTRFAPDVSMAIYGSSEAGEIAYHLAKNPEIADSIAQLDTISAIKELGKLEARFTSTKSKSGKKITKMTAPIKGAENSTSNSNQDWDSSNTSQADFNNKFPMFLD